MSTQKGVFRINCIDCLDRTNVVQVIPAHIPYERIETDYPVQSAFARYVLNNQLGAVALLNPGMEGRTETDNVFNDGGCFPHRKRDGTDHNAAYLQSGRIMGMLLAGLSASFSPLSPILF
jgi:hypothetical protein